MAGRGATTFQKRQKEMQRKERQQEKFAKRMERKKQSEAGSPDENADFNADLNDDSLHDESLTPVAGESTGGDLADRPTDLPKRDTLVTEI